MKGINYKVLLSKWDEVVELLCEEVTAHDVLEVVVSTIEKTKLICMKENIDHKHLENAIDLIRQAMILIDPEK